MKLHPLLERQLRHACGGGEKVPSSLEPLLVLVSAAYDQADQDRRLVEHSLEEMSVELTQRNRELRQELEERKNTGIALQREQKEQAALIEKLEQAHAQLLQSEKLASIGQLAAGVAHEINNPVGYVQANVSALEDYLHDLFGYIDSCEAVTANLPPEHPAREPLEQAKRVRDIDYLRGDIPALLGECKEGLTRVRKIVQDLKDFSHPDEGSVTWSDLHQGLDSTLNIVHNELKYKAEVLREYGALPKIQCNLTQLNQVFMNLLVNASHAISDKGIIRVRSGQDESTTVWVEISDTGCGIPEESFGRIFDPFYTTKPVGKGTGLGLSLSYAIVQRHHGRIDVRSKLGEGTTFRVTLPVVQPDAGEDGAGGTAH